MLVYFISMLVQRFLRNVNTRSVWKSLDIVSEFLESIDYALEKTLLDYKSQA